MIRRFAKSEMAGNFLWLAVSLLLASGVWYIAVTSADPIKQSRFTFLPIQFVSSDATVRADASQRTATVTVQGPQTTISLLSSDDIVVRADLSRLSPGVHAVPLTVSVVQPESTTRKPVAQVSPSQIRVTLEKRETVAVGIVIVPNAPPIGFRHDAPLPGVAEAQVSGAASVVAQVAEVRGMLDLSASRNPIEAELRLQAVDADGNRVSDVELMPESVQVSVNIARRDDIRQIVVRPNVMLDTLPDGYTLKNWSPDPEILYVSGAPDRLARISDTLFTEPISLENRQEGFVTTIPVQLPDEELFVVGGDNSVMVSIEIIPVTESRQFDNIEIEHVGLGEGYAVSIAPKRVSAIVSGPVVMVDALSDGDIRVFVDLEGLTPALYDLEARTSILRGELSESNVSLVPRAVNVEITSPQSESDSPDEAADEPAPADG